MDRDLAIELNTEIKKIRNDMDAIKAYTKTMAEQMEIIAQNTTPENETQPADVTEPVGGET